MKKLLLSSLFVVSLIFAQDQNPATSYFDQGYYVGYEVTVNVGTTPVVVTPAIASIASASIFTSPIFDAMEISPPSTAYDVFYSQTSLTNPTMAVGAYVISAVGKKYSNTSYGVRDISLVKSAGSAVVTVRWLNKKQMY